MRDAFGGIVNISTIVVFLVLVSGYLAFNVNYTKAFRVKNYIITSLEQHEGKCMPDSGENDCTKQIKEYMSSIGYNTDSPHRESDGYQCTTGYCIKKELADESTKNSTTSGKVYYKVVTQVNIDIPIINKIMPNFRVFQLSGSTKLIRERS